MVAKLDISGKTFGRLVAIRVSDDATSLKHTCWLCECSCGQWAIVDVAKLNNGHTKSCGCYGREVSTLRLSEMSRSNIRYPKMNAEDWRFYNSSIRTKSSKYGITEDILRDMMNAQRGCCSICENSLDYLPEGYHIDHCHKTGKVRGLLCGQCNRGLGIFKDNVQYLKNAIKYLGRI